MKELLFGHNGHCFWLCITTPEILKIALERFKFTDKEEETYLSLLNEGHTVFVNSEGGYHYGQIEGYMSSLTRSNRFPSDSLGV